MHARRICRSFPLLSLLVAAAPAPSQEAAAQEQQVAYGADPNAPLLPVRLDAHAAISWDGTFGIGARVDIPILEKGFTYSSRDELAISVGADVIFLSFDDSTNPIDVWPTAVLQWSLGVSDRFSFYPELGLTAKIERDGWAGVYPNVGFGGRYYVYRSIALMGRLGWPMAISLGATF